MAEDTGILVALQRLTIKPSTSNFKWSGPLQCTGSFDFFKIYSPITCKPVAVFVVSHEKPEE